MLFMLRSDCREFNTKERPDSAVGPTTELNVRADQRDVNSWPFTTKPANCTLELKPSLANE